jgi:hypothetical protein
LLSQQQFNLIYWAIDFQGLKMVVQLSEMAGGWRTVF